jgi:hypothetical protein
MGGPWAVVYYKAGDGTVPAEAFLDGCPTGVEAKIEAVLTAVAAAPPPSFSGGGMWEAMHGDMTGYFEVRVSGPKREQFRLFCLLDREGPGLDRPAIVALTGLRKPFMTTFTGADYARVRELGDGYKASDPRSIAK